MPTAKDVIRLSLDASDHMLTAYVDDLSDADLLVTAVEGTNPVAWHFGHLISAERYFVEKLAPGSSPPLPDGFDAAHGAENAAPHPFKPIASKAEYLAWWKAQRAATLAALDALSDETLDAPTGVSYAPTAAALMNMIGGHALGHIGQFVAVRRKLGKPVKV